MTTRPRYYDDIAPRYYDDIKGNKPPPKHQQKSTPQNAKTIVGQGFFDVMPIEKDSFLLTAKRAFSPPLKKWYMFIYVFIPPQAALLDGGGMAVYNADS